MVEGVDEEVEHLLLFGVKRRREVDRRLLDLDDLRARRGELAKLLVHGRRHVPDQLLLVVAVVRRVWLSRKIDRTCTEHVPNLTGLPEPGACLGDPPQLGVLERVPGVVLDLAHDARPAPRRLDLVHQRAGGKGEQAVARPLVLQLLVLEARPALERVVMPRAAGVVLVELVVAVGQDVEPGPLLFGQHDRVSVQELLAEADVEQRRVERPAPQADVVPARPRPRSGNGRREYQVLGRSQHPPASRSDARTGLPVRERTPALRRVAVDDLETLRFAPLWPALARVAR